MFYDCRFLSFVVFQSVCRTDGDLEGSSEIKFAPNFRKAALCCSEEARKSVATPV